jgi:signal transduction histidine kinase
MEGGRTLPEHPGTSALFPTGLLAGLQLLASYVLAAGAGAAVVLAALHPGPGTAVLAVLAGTVAGLLAGATLVRTVVAGGIALHRLARGLPVAPIPARSHWPLAPAVRDLNAVAGRLAAQAEREAETGAFRSRLLEQVSEAAAQEERNRLARDLHDSIKQQIFSMSVSAAAARARWEHDPGGARAALADIERGAREAQVEMEALLAQLRPAALEEVGLQEALRIQCEALAYRTGAEVELSAEGLPPGDLVPPTTMEALFRIAQELLANVARHARARRVAVWLGQEEGSVVLRVRDDGQGFSAGRIGPGPGTGLAGIRERAQALGGRFRVESAPGEGALAEVRLPIFAPMPVASGPPDDADARRLQRERRTALTAGTRAAQITVLVIFLTGPIGAVLLGTAVAAGAYVWALLLGLRVEAAERAVDGTARQAQWGLLAGILGLAALEVWYLPVAQSGIRLHFGTGILLALSLPIALAALLTALAWYRAIDRSFTGLPGEERRREAAGRIQYLRASLGLWAVIVLVTAFLLPPSPALPPHSLGQWSDAAAIAILVAWPLIDGVDYLLTSRRRAISVVA